MTGEVTIETQGAVATVRICRPEALNALNSQVLSSLLEAFRKLTHTDAARAIVLTGSGDRAFVAGADIRDFIEAGPLEALAIAHHVRAVTDAMAACPKPIIAAINGHCLGGGLELALATDIRIASCTARFGLPEIKLGIIPGGGGTVRLTKLVGSAAAKMLAMTGDPIDAQRALSLGIVSSVHDDMEALLTAADRIAERLAGYPPFAMMQLKACLNGAIDAPTDQALDAEIIASSLCFATPDKDEGMQAFVEKRAPLFKGAVSKSDRNI